MSRLLKLSCLAALVGLTACEEYILWPVECDTMAAVSVTAEVVDADGQAVAAEVFYDDGSGEQPCEDWGDGSYACGYEIPGELVIRAQAEGYVDASEEVFIDSDECHVIGQSLVLEIQPEVAE
jgi:hypothetical protein